MIDGLRVIDNFMPSVDAVREHALASEFVDWLGHDGQTYRRICLTDPPGLQERIERECGRVNMLGMGYRLNYSGEMPNTLIHSDLGWGTHALVLYLNDGEGGTAFWQHRETAAQRINPGDVPLLEVVQKDWNDPRCWFMREMIGMKKGRAIIYDSALFHSRYPFSGFGSTPENGRLIAVAFFTPLERVL